MITTNGKGISLFTLEGINFEKFTRVEQRRRLVKDEKPGHHMPASASTMPAVQHKGLLEKTSLGCNKYLKIHKAGRIETAA